MIRGSVSVVLVCCLTVAANAQPLPDVATDQELHAAYCLGAVIAQEEKDPLKGLALNPADPMAEVQQQVKETLDRHISRFREYLVARGLLSGERSISATTGVGLARERGQADVARCSMQINSCVSKYSSQRPYVQKYIENCRDEEDACRTYALCFKDDRLPF
jgi:hypothetical protein